MPLLTQTKINYKNLKNIHFLIVGYLIFIILPITFPEIFTNLLMPERSSYTIVPSKLSNKGSSNKIPNPSESAAHNPKKKIKYILKPR